MSEELLKIAPFWMVFDPNIQFAVMMIVVMRIITIVRMMI